MKQHTEVEQLLKPRYKVIADWPNTDFKMGEIVSTDNKIDLNFYSKYPHLFKKLEWWEERKPEDMPQYVKENIALTLSEKEPQFHKLGSVDGEWFMPEGKKFIQRSLSVFLPATEEEFNNQKQIE